jgi:hypothetical protein
MASKSLTDHAVKAQVRALVTTGNVVWRVHAEEQMAARGFDKGQVKQCLCQGTFAERPHVPNRRGPLQYEFKMRARVDREPMEVVASLYPETEVVVITVIDPN